jgi:chaperone BCS1
MDEQHIQIRTLGWSTAPLKALLASIKKWSLEREHDITVIKRPQSKETRRREGAWTRVTSRPSRPMNTVVLDAKQKDALIADVNEYLSPTSPQWYASRGIPLRRGYLFHGPPGTGKSSLSFALAGLFGLDIHVISLLEPTLTEGDLQQLFNNLPKRCIVLLEDIDTAGLHREDKADDSRSDNEYEKVSPNGGGGRRGGPRSTAVETEATSTGISLSGLLNAIDGVASHEGRVLIMTSNFPEKLDAALIRPGRVDMQVAFTLATKLQIKEIFIKMYASDTKRLTEESEHTPADKKGKAIATKRTFSRDELQPLADKFAAHLPEDKFSPAEVQNFLITRKKDPYKALKEIEAWSDELLESKEKKSRIVTVM